VPELFRTAPTYGAGTTEQCRVSYVEITIMDAPWPRQAQAHYNNKSHCMSSADRATVLLAAAMLAHAVNWWCGRGSKLYSLPNPCHPQKCDRQMPVGI
jgi:protein tyrosine/serine phosphatase